MTYMISRSRFFSACILILLLLSGCRSSYETHRASYPHQPKTTGEKSSIAFVSDTQSPLWFEKLRLKSDHNEQATQRILDAIAADSTCAALFHCGDVTALGSFESYWQKFDNQSRALRKAGIPIYPAFGNHEYMPLSKSGKQNMIDRFPFMKEPWYDIRIGSIAVVLLNSNFSQLSRKEIERQQQWYEQTLRDFDADTTLAVVLVGCHHPPFTNSTIVDPSTEVQQRFVPPFMKSQKAKLFVSGHSHAFEHFRHEGKDFLVIGGGGGLLHPLLQGNSQRWPDKFHWKDTRRFFHFVRMTAQNNHLHLQIIPLMPADKDFELPYIIDIPYY